MGDAQKLLAELFGTFTLVFVGSLSILATLATDAPIQIAVAFGFGLALLAGLYAFAEVSGGHFNPAVSLAMALDRRLGIGSMVAYWAAQFGGAILGSLAVLAAFSRDDVAATTTLVSGDMWDAFWLEFILTALFVAVILQVTRSQKFGNSALVAIPLTLVAIHLAAIPFSGSSVNPARSLGPALVGNEWTDFWVYLTAPLAGAFVGWVVYTVAAKGMPSSDGGAAAAAEGEAAAS